MDAIEKMMDEHQNILVLTRVIRQAAIDILEGSSLPLDDFREMTFYAQHYADKYHHGKEEDILFLEMTEKLGLYAEQIIKHGMVVEHDLGRMYIFNVNQALDCYEDNQSVGAKLDAMVNLVAWANHLEKHIHKEDTAIYQYARRELSQASLESVHAKVLEFEDNVADRQLMYHCDAILRRLQNKYCQ